MPFNMYIHHDDAYYDVQNQPPDWIPPDPPVILQTPSSAIDSLVDYIDVLSYYHALKSLQNISLSNSRYTLLDLSSHLYSRIMIQSR